MFIEPCIKTDALPEPHPSRYVSAPFTLEAKNIETHVYKHEQKVRRSNIRTDALPEPHPS